MIIALVIIGLFTFVILVSQIVQSFLFWTMHKRIEALAAKVTEFGTELQTHVEKVDNLIKKVTEGENVIIENFTNLDKRVAKLEHEIKDAKYSEVKAKEALKAVSRLQRATSIKQADAV